MVTRTKGTILVISGPSGAGKSAVIDLLVKDFGFSKIVSCTTRTKRNSDKRGDYRYLDEAKYFELLRGNKFVSPEPVLIYGYYYGLLTSDFEKPLKRGRKTIVALAKKTPFLIKEKFPENTFLVYILPPSKDALLNRLAKRGMNSAQTVIRLEEDKKDIAAFLFEYDLIIVNYENRIRETVEEILNFIKTKRRKR